MESTNREIIDSFVPRLPDAYIVFRFATGALADEVPGYQGLLTRAASKGLFTTLNVPLWDGASTDPANPDKLWVEFAPYIDLDTLPLVPADPSDPFADPLATAEDLYFANNARRFEVRLVNQPDPVPVGLPQAYRSPGLYLIRYRVRVADSGNDNFSVAQLLVVDETSPYDRPRINPPAPTLPAGVTVPVDRAYFQSQPNQTANFPIAYSAVEGKQSDDYAELFFGSSDRPYAFAPPDPETKFRIDPNNPTLIPLPLSVVNGERRGNYTLRYKLYDVGGSPSETSYSLELTDLEQAPAPTDFLAPFVDLAVPGDGLIHREDVRVANGVRVLIPPFTNAQRPSEQVEVTLTGPGGVSVTRTVTLGTQPFPVPAQFDVTQISSLYPAGSTGSVLLTASYVVRRGGTTYPTPPASTPFDLDLSVVGPPPTGPTDVNTNLPPVVVNAIRPGGVFGPNDNLEAADANRDARARVPLWDTATLPESSVPFTVTLSYGTYTATQIVQTIDPLNRNVDFTIPFATIRALGGPTQLASYTITSAASANPQRSVDTTVTVNSVVLRIDAVAVLRNSGILNCDTLDPINSGRLVLHIPGSDYTPANAVLTVRYRGYQTNDATGAPVVDITRDVTVPTDNAGRNGFDVPFDARSADIYNPIQANRSFLALGSAVVTFSVQYQGQTVTSDAQARPYRVRGFRPGTGASYYCAGGAIPV